MPRKNGWINKGGLVFKANKSSGDYHSKVNSEVFENWLRELICTKFAA
jgi:hypothetical protein